MPRVYKKLQFTENQKKTIKSLWGRVSIKTIAKKLKAAHYRVCAAAKEMGLPKLRSEYKPSNDFVSLIAKWLVPENRQAIETELKKDRVLWRAFRCALLKRKLIASSVKKWTKEESEKLKSMWGDYSARSITDAFKGVPWSNIKRKAERMNLPMGSPQGWTVFEEACRLSGYDRRQLRLICDEQHVKIMNNPYRESLSDRKEGTKTAGGRVSTKYAFHRFVEMDAVREAVEYHLKGKVRPPETDWIKDSRREFESSVPGVGLGRIAGESGVEPEDGDEESDVDCEEDEPPANKRSVNKKARVVRKSVHSLPAFSQNTLSSSTEPLNALRSQR